MFLVSNLPYSMQYTSLLTEKSILALSKQRIIQKNLVHFQGFPDSLYDQQLLLSPEYFGQYGNIIKIDLVSKEDKILKKKTNSAYLTYETKEQAAYCILSVDSIKIGNCMVRAFFGTTKYCTHFLNNYHCFNEEKCMFLHHIAEASDIIDENTKFGYNDHIKLAKKIIGYGSFQSRCYVMNNSTKLKTVLPNIKNLYYKEDTICTKIIKNNNHRRNNSNSSNNSTENNSFNRSNNRTLSLSPSKNEASKTNSSEKIKYENNNILKDEYNDNNNTYFSCFKSENKSRFFNNNNNNKCNNDKVYQSKNITNIIDNLFKRNLFFNKYKNNKQLPSLKDLEYNYCLKIYEKTKDNDIKLLLENMF